MAADDTEFIKKYIDNIRSGIIIAVVLTIVVTLAAVIWFNMFEGRKGQD
jgi:5,10-methenyltetrahydromethanopterin hydrogenase